jgi:hypothetical protein
MHDDAGLIHAKLTQDEDELLDQRKDARAEAHFVNSDQCALLQNGLVLPKSTDNEINQVLRGDVLRAHLNNAWSLCVRSRKDGSEIQVVGEDNMVVVVRPSQDHGVGAATVLD